MAKHPDPPAGFGIATASDFAFSQVLTSDPVAKPLDF
jgi:hypothetical protein